MKKHYKLNIGGSTIERINYDKKELPSGEFFERDEGKSFLPRKVFPQKNSIFNFKLSIQPQFLPSERYMSLRLEWFHRLFARGEAMKIQRLSLYPKERLLFYPF